MLGCTKRMQVKSYFLGLRYFGERWDVQISVIQFSDDEIFWKHWDSFNVQICLQMTKPWAFCKMLAVTGAYDMKLEKQ